MKIERPDGTKVSGFALGHSYVVYGEGENNNPDFMGPTQPTFWACAESVITPATAAAALSTIGSIAAMVIMVF